MRPRSVLLIAFAAALAAPSVARADTERYFVAEGFHPEGVSLGAFAQAGGFLSSSCCEIGGRRGAGGGGIRLGTVATDRILLSLQLEGATVPIEDSAGKTKFNKHGTFTLGVQYYLRDTLWYRAALGFATYTIESVEEETLVEDLQRSGFAFTSSLGLDFVQLSDVWAFGLSRQDFALTYELHFVSALYPSGEVAGETQQELGAIVQLTMGLGVHWY